MNELNSLFKEALEDERLNDDFSFIRDLLDRGADPNIDLLDGETPLSIAVGSGKLELVNLLLSSGAKVSGYSVYVAALHDSKETLEVLISHGGQVCAIDKNSALHEAVRHRNHEILRLLLEQAGGQQHINCFDEIERTPLMVAVAARDKRTANLLMAKGADVNAMNYDLAGTTALVIAVNNKDYDMVCTLLRAGADPLLSSPGRPSAWDTVKRFEREPHVRIKQTMAAHVPERLRKP